MPILVAQRLRIERWRADRFDFRSSDQTGPGSVNTSLPGKDRKAKKRALTVRVLGSAAPEKPVAITLYAQPSSGDYQDIIYRVYVADKAGASPAAFLIPTRN